jgi:threonine/homoserine/homoserine lactone efflux protein
LTGRIFVMLGIHGFWLFIISGLLLNITPGPDTAYIIGRSVQSGWRSGVAAALGIGTGCITHVLAAAVGLSALLVASATAFTAVKWLGAAYLCYIGLTMLLSRRQKSEESAGHDNGPVSLRRVFWQGALTNMLNPKVAMFFLAFLPQFVDADAPHKALAFLILGLIFVFNGTLWCLGVAVVAARAAGRVRRSGGALALINRGLGALFVYLGLRIAFAQAK